MPLEIESSWKEILENDLPKEIMDKIELTLQMQLETGGYYYPPKSLIFDALRLTPFNSVKVVILGQDPYHGKNQAHGLSFSVPKGVPLPPSLKNIFKELKNEFPEFIFPTHGDLTPWAKQGVLLLNSSLTVEAGKPGSHQHLGWHSFTDLVIKMLSDKRTGIIFLLWGKQAQEKLPLIDQFKHVVLTAAHPSPFSAYRGFLGCDHFRKTNEILEKNGQRGIDWQLKNEQI